MQTEAVQWSYQDLDLLLGQEEWQAADQVTLALMLAATHREAEGWLDEGAIARIPCEVLNQLDQHWMRYSNGRFGFTAQQQIYRQRCGKEAFAFSREVEWTVARFRLFGFFKFYNFLNFSLDAPQGHLPALWFWHLPWYRSWRMGGIGTGRGAAFGDAHLFDALMLRLERCQSL
ncbi:MAG: GUN4 domain-containing protein [Cyanobacteria bacterium]|nr:GUN4 domain-containing protein [Cyanobacteriota bacterium]MDA0865092.1 GUN4 domain-containing protein [Cyanobacteriota bacterium]